MSYQSSQDAESDSQQLKFESEELEQEELVASELEEEEQKRAMLEEAYDPEKPEDLKTEIEKVEEKEEEEEEGARELGDGEDSADSREGQEEDSDDSIVKDEIEYECKNHSVCIKFAKEVDAMIMKECSVSKSSAKERQVALCEVLCDHYISY